MSDGFLARWTRRKRAVRDAELAERAAADEAAPDGADAAADSAAPRDAAEGEVAAPAAPRTASDPAEEAPAEAADPLPELPDPATLTRESDLAPFLRAGVPTALRNAALRRMWSIDPAIRDFVSEAREYAYDWNSPGGVPGLGPLLPSDDVQAMLRRIIGGVPPQEAAPEAGEVPAVAEAAPDTAPDIALDEAAAPEPEQAAAEPGPALPQPDSLPPAEAAAPPIPAAVPEGAGPAPRPGAEPAKRLRRHGGAMPG